MEFWKKRLDKFNIAYTETSRFGETYLQFKDPHGLQLELVERESGEENSWTFGGVTKEVAIKGFGGAVLYSSLPEETTKTLIDVMGLEVVGQEGTTHAFNRLPTSEISSI